MLITHNLGVVAELRRSRRRDVFAARVAEEGHGRRRCSMRPRHPYTRWLCSALTSRGSPGRAAPSLRNHSEGAPPDPASIRRPGCRFAARCHLPRRYLRARSGVRPRSSPADLIALLARQVNRGGRNRPRAADVDRSGRQARRAGRAKNSCYACAASPSTSSRSRARAALCSARSKPAEVRAVDGVSFDLSRGRGAGPGRRIRLRQIDDRGAFDRCVSIDADIGQRRSSSKGQDVLSLGKAGAAAELRPVRRKIGDLPGPAFLARSAHDGRSQIVDRAAGRAIGDRAR
jgi:hypothetical protein